MVYEGSCSGAKTCDWSHLVTCMASVPSYEESMRV